MWRQGRCQRKQGAGLIRGCGRVLLLSQKDEEVVVTGVNSDQEG